MQAAHALRAFVAEHPEVDRHWFETSNTLAFLAARDEEHLERLKFEATQRGIRFAEFREPDLGDALTAVAFEPSAGKLVRSLPLALRCSTAA